MKKYFLIVFVFILSFCKNAKTNVVIDESLAVKIAEDTLRKVMDMEEFESMRPFKAKLLDSNKVWEVKSVDIAEFAGLPPTVLIKKSNGKTKKIRWGEGDID